MNARRRPTDPVPAKERHPKLSVTTTEHQGSYTPCWGYHLGAFVLHGTVADDIAMC